MDHSMLSTHQTPYAATGADPERRMGAREAPTQAAKSVVGT